MCGVGSHGARIMVLSVLVDLFGTGNGLKTGETPVRMVAGIVTRLLIPRSLADGPLS
jgi:hypothetical protein